MNSVPDIMKELVNAMAWAKVFMFVFSKFTPYLVTKYDT